MLVAAARTPLNPVQNREFLNARSQVIRRMQKDIPPDTRPRHVVASCEVRMRPSSSPIAPFPLLKRYLFNHR